VTAGAAADFAAALSLLPKLAHHSNCVMGNCWSVNDGSSSVGKVAFVTGAVLQAWINHDT
jgi:hypothetical protein